jgi:hypothetical protein
LQAIVVITGDYRLPAGEQPRETDGAQIEYHVLSQRRHLRQAALDCYNVTKSTLPAGWQLDNLNFQDGNRLSAQGIAPTDQTRVLYDVENKLMRAQGQDGKNLFVPSTSQTQMRVATPGLTNFSWSMQFDLRSPESL